MAHDARDQNSARRRALTPGKRALGHLAWAAGLAPGVLLCGAVSAAALFIQSLEARLLGRAWLEAIAIAIVLGAAVRGAWTPGRAWTAGIAFSAKVLLEVAVVLLGASVSAAAVLAAGPVLLAGIASVVVVAVVGGYAVGRLLGLSHHMSTLIACGNAICGNSAIAAIAPAIGAEPDDTAASIAFTAVLGVIVVLMLPLLGVWLRLTPASFGVFAGLTVYAVPQVLAATAPVSALSAQVGTLVKLVRVLMLGPVVLAVSLLARTDRRATGVAGPAGIRLGQLVPWFILGFAAMLAARSAGWIPAPALAAASKGAGGLTIISMAALGLGVDARSLGAAGPRATAAVVLCIVGLGLVSLLLIHIMRMH
jgi:uncharacterized integral membrane protein (TIGR00698 family)